MMDHHQNEIIVTMISVDSPPQPLNQEKKPPKVPPRTKKRLQTKESETVITTMTTTTTTTTTTLVNDQPETPCPEIPSRTKEPVIPPPIPSALKPNKRATLQSRQLLETEFLKANNPQREVLVAATKAGNKDKRAEARQRQPALLIRPNQDPAKIVDRHEFESGIIEKSAPRSEKGRKGPTFLVLPNSKVLSPIPHHHQGRGMFPGRNSQAPLLTRMVFPRPPNAHLHAVPPTGPPVSYGKWLEKSGNGDPEINTRILRRIFGGHQMPFKSSKSNHIAQAGSSYKNLVPPGHKTPIGQLFSSKSKLVVSRSGSLSSQCSTSSDSGNESQPKSVLKKSRRNKGVEKPKKSVTFNAMTTVQVMEE